MTQDLFNQEYIEQGKPLDDIAKRHGISRDDITFVRQLYGVKSTGSKYQHRKATETPLTDRQKEILYGSLLGDAQRLSPSSVKFGHGYKQKCYVEWKYDEFKSVASPRGIYEEVSFDARYNKESSKIA